MNDKKIDENHEYVPWRMISRAPTAEEIDCAKKFLDGLSRAESGAMTHYYDGEKINLYFPGSNQNWHAEFLACNRIAAKEYGWE